MNTKPNRSYVDIRVRSTTFLISYLLILVAVTSEKCTDPVTVGSLSHDNIPVTDDQTFILADYTVPCSGTVVAWEFCYQVTGTSSVTFYPGIWRITETSGVNTDYELVQSNIVTYNPSVRDPQDATNDFPCQIFNLSDTDQFTAPAGSIVGLYSNVGMMRPLLLHTNIDSSIATYQFSGNQSSVRAGNNDDVNYNVTVRVHLVTSDMPTTVISTASSSISTQTSNGTSTRTTTTIMPTISTAMMTPTGSTATITPTGSTATMTPTGSTATMTPTGSTATMTPTGSIATTILTGSSAAMISTDSTATMILTGRTATMMPSSDVQTGGQDSSSIVIGVVVACVVGIVVICVIIVTLLLWYLKRRKGKDNDVQGLVHSYNHEREGSERFSDHQYSVCESTMNGVISKSNIGDYETADNAGSYSSGCSRRSELSRYVDSTSTTYKNYTKASNDDYVAPPNLNEYESLYSQISEVPTPYQYEVAGSSIYSDSVMYNTVGEALAANEEIYEDPGHKEEKIYAWFESKKFRKINIKDIEILHGLGSGEFGVVNLGLWSNGSTDPVQVAVKTLNSQCSESDRVKFLREAAIMGQFVHNNVVQLHGVVTKKKNMMIILEYMPKGDLREYLIDIKNNSKNYQGLPVKLLNFCRQTAAGMNYLANKHFVHRDLAARNILVSSDDMCKIADFGMARDVGDDTYYVTSGGKLPLKWTSPEAIYFKKFSVQSDVWSFGCVMFEIWSLGCKPYEDLDGREYVEKVTTGYRLPPPPGCPRSVYELMIQCWHPTVNSRPLPGLILQALQNSEENTNSLQVTDDKVTSDSHSMMLGASLTTGSQLYLDLQLRYKANSTYVARQQ